MKLKSSLVLGYSTYNTPNNFVGSFGPIFPFHRAINYFTDFTLIDAVVLWGGADISPSLYNESPIVFSGPHAPSHRDSYEWELLKNAVQRNIPIIGVCRGAQIMCAFAGGTLIQNVTNHQTYNGGDHTVQTNDGIFQTKGDHHQMMSPNKIEHTVLAWCDPPQSEKYEPNDTYGANLLIHKHIVEPEVIYFPTINGLAIQAHPEWETTSNSWTEWLNKQIIKHLTSLSIDL